MSMPLQKGTRRYQHYTTGEVKYFKNPPNPEKWAKIGTPGSKNWRWIHNITEEKFISPKDTIPPGYSPGRLKS